MRIYSGETIEGVMVFTDDENQLINDFSNLEIKLLIRNRYDDYSILLTKSEMSISEGQIRFTIPPEKTMYLKISALLELKVIESDVVKIVKSEGIEVVDNYIKDM